MPDTDHKHEWKWDHEQPPGYICECDATLNSCEVCEQPCVLRFCSNLCEAQSDEDNEVIK